MASIRDISIGNQYTGNSVLGGGYYQGISIDTTPLQRLATFTYYRDRDLWMKRVAEDKAAAAQIADLTAYDIRSPMKGYTDYLLSKKQEAKDFLEKNPNALYFDRDKKGFQKLHEIIGDFNTARASANLSDVMYNARKSAIDKLTEGADKTAAQLGLDMDVKNLFANGIDYALNHTLASAEELNPDSYKLPTIPYTQREFVINDKNGTAIKKVKFGDLAVSNAQMDGIWFGLKKPLDETTDEFKRLTDDEKKLLRAQDAVIHKQRIGIDSATQTFNGMLDQLKNKYKDVKIETINTDNLPESLKRTIDSVKSYNEQIDKLNFLTKEKFERLNLDDGFTGPEFLRLQQFQANGETLYTEPDLKIQESEQHRMEIARGNLKARWAEVGISQQRLDKENDGDLLDADAVLRTVSSIIKKGEATVAGRSIPDINIPSINYFKKGVKVNEDVFVIAEPSLLKEFGRIDKEGNQYDVPNIVEYNKKTGQLNLKYYTPDSDEKKTTIDESRTKTLDERDWLGIKVKQMFPNKEIGNVNALINQALKANNNSLYELSVNYDKPKTDEKKPEDKKTSTVPDKSRVNELRTKYNY